MSEEVAIDTGEEMQIVDYDSLDTLSSVLYLGKAYDTIGNACRFIAPRVKKIDELYRQIDAVLDPICCKAMRENDYSLCRELIRKLPDRSFHRTELRTFLIQAGQKI